MSYGFKSALKKAKVGDHRVHDCRHTYASLMLSEGAKLIYVSGQLGHATPMITLGIYAHAMPDEANDAVNMLAGIYKNA